MSQRTTLQEKLEQILGTDHVYFQPPSTIRMQYPCIKYDIQQKQYIYANNKKYLDGTTYSLTLMDYDPESPYVRAIEDLPYCRFNRKYKADQLNHFVFDLYLPYCKE